MKNKTLLPSFPELNFPSNTTTKASTTGTNQVSNAVPSKLTEPADNTSPFQRSPAVLRKTSNTLDKVLLKVNLVKIPPRGFGIGLARDRSQEGVFVVSILPGGVAAKDGR